MCTFGNQFLGLVPGFCWVTHKKGLLSHSQNLFCVWLSKIQALELRTGSHKCTCKQANRVLAYNRVLNNSNNLSRIHSKITKSKIDLDLFFSYLQALWRDVFLAQFGISLFYMGLHFNNSFDEIVMWTDGTPFVSLITYFGIYVWTYNNFVLLV